jgi:hypothetical protein
MTILQEVEDFKRKLLAERLSQLTEPQRERFNWCFPNGVPEKDLIGAISLCDRTIIENKTVK